MFDRLVWPLVCLLPDIFEDLAGCFQSKTRNPMLNLSVTSSMRARVTYPQHTMPCRSITPPITAQIVIQAHLPFLAQSRDPVVTRTDRIPQVPITLSLVLINHYRHARFHSTTPHRLRKTPAPRWLKDRVLVRTLPGFHSSPSHRPSPLNEFASPFCQS